MALETSFCFRPHSPETQRHDVNQPESGLTLLQSHVQLLTCDVSAVNPAGVRRDKLRQQLENTQEQEMHLVVFGALRAPYSPTLFFILCAEVKSLFFIFSPQVIYLILPK